MFSWEIISKEDGELKPIGLQKGYGWLFVLWVFEKLENVHHGDDDGRGCGPYALTTKTVLMIWCLAMELSSFVDAESGKIHH